MADVPVYFFAGQSNMEGAAGAGTFAGLPADLDTVHDEIKVWNDKAGGVSAAITAVSWESGAKRVYVTLATPHGVDVTSEQEVALTIAGNSGTGAAEINGLWAAKAVDADTLYFDHTTARSGAPSVDGTATAQGGGAWESLDPRGKENHHTEPPAAPGYFGPELRLAKLLAASEGATPANPIYIVKYAVPGTTMVASPAPSANTRQDWAWGSNECTREMLFGREFRAGNAILAAVDKPIYKGLFWLQGETDAGASWLASAYAHYWAEWILNVRATFYTLKLGGRSAASSPDLIPLVVGQIATQDKVTFPGSDGDGATLETVRAAQRSVGVGDTNYYLADLWGLSTSDGIHFDASGVETAAQLLFAAYLNPASNPLSKTPCLPYRGDDASDRWPSHSRARAPYGITASPPPGVVGVRVVRNGHHRPVLRVPRPVHRP